MAVEQRERGAGRRRHEARRAQREQAGVLGMLRLDVLVRRDRAQHERLGQVRGDRAQDQDPRDRRVAVELGDRLRDQFEARIRRQHDVAGVEPDTVGGAVDAALVDPRGLIGVIAAPIP